MSEQKELKLTSVYEQRSESGENLLVRNDNLQIDEFYSEFIDIDQVYDYITKDFTVLKNTYPADIWKVDFANCHFQKYLYPITFYRKYLGSSGRYKTHIVKYQIHMVDDDKKHELLDRLEDTYEEILT